MCGIVGYVGDQSALQVVLDGLKRLEYRGYDSAGVAILTSDELRVAKKAGKLTNLEKAIQEAADATIEAGTTGIGHTRWATHGGPTDRNAHPHVSHDGRIAVIHNGIIENFGKLRAALEASGVEFGSDTDTECVAHLLANEFALTGDLAEAMRRVCRQLEGAFTLLAVETSSPDRVVGARRNSPLVVGRGQGENFLASDVSAIVGHTREAVYLHDYDIVCIDGYRDCRGHDAPDTRRLRINGAREIVRSIRTAKSSGRDVTRRHKPRLDTLGGFPE